MASPRKKLSCIDQIEKIQKDREERRKKMDDLKKQKTHRDELNQAIGMKVDVDFQVMVQHNWQNV